MFPNCKAMHETNCFNALINEDAMMGLEDYENSMNNYRNDLK